MAKRGFSKRRRSSPMNFLTNKWVLYLLTIIGLVQLVGYGIYEQWCSTIFFVLIGLLSYSFSKNLIVVLGVAIVGSLFFCQLHTSFGLFREGLSDKDNDDTKDDEPQDEADDAENFAGSRHVDKAETARRNYENMRKMIGSGGITQMSRETSQLMNQQTKMVENMEKLRPMAQEAAGLLEKLEGSQLLKTMATNKSNFQNTQNHLGALKKIA